jgi:cytochrome c-type biogenesis protein CcmH/NrfG
MRLWRRQSQACDLAAYSAVANAVRKRRAARKETPCEIDAFSPSSASNVHAYRPQDRLLERDAQARRLVENARDIPRTWEPERPPSCHSGDDIWSLCAFVLALSVAVVISVIVLLTAYILALKIAAAFR